MIFLPEAADFIAPAASVHSLSQPIATGQNSFLDGIRNCAKDEAMWVNVCVHESISSDDDAATKIPTGEILKRCYNTNVVFDDSGELQGVYRKIHLFDVDLAPAGPRIKESDTTKPGSILSSPIHGTPVGNLGLQTCYDVRFSRPADDLTRASHVDPAAGETESLSAHSLTYPSAFAPVTGAAHWELLLRARAVEGQCYVFAAAQSGEHFPGRRSYGHAMIVDPWGTVLAQCPQTSEASICVADVDLDRVAQVRREMPMGR